MTITDPLALCGNIIGFVAVAAKTIYDLYLNPRQFRQDEKTLGLLKAAEQKRARADSSTLWTFLVIGIGYMFSIAALIKIS